jgi:hypothetical protein
LTKIKAISAIAAALAITAVGAVTASAWQGVILSAAQDCTHQMVYVSADDTKGFLHGKDSPSTGTLSVVDSHGKKVASPTWTFDKKGGETQVIASISLAGLTVGETYKISMDGASDVAAVSITIKSCPAPAPTCPPLALTIATPTVTGNTLTWIVHNPNSVAVDFGYLLNDSTTTHSSSAKANSDAPAITVDVIVGVNKLAVAPVAGDTVCQPTIRTFTYTPKASASPTATATASPTSTVAPTSTAVPSPPATGSGPNGSHDNSFGIVLLVLVVGTGIAGGTTLALSRKGN